MSNKFSTQQCKKQHASGVKSFAGSLALVLLLASCAAPPANIPEGLEASKSGDASGTNEFGESTPQQRKNDRPFTERMPGTPEVQQQDSGVAENQQQPIGAGTNEPGSINVRQVPVGDFARLVYADVLERTVQIDQRVANSRDLVTLRTPEDLPPEEIAALARTVLSDYGISVSEQEGVVQVSKDDGTQSALPAIRRGSALPEMPGDLRPIFHMVDLTAVRNTDVASWVRTMFGDRVQMREDAIRNAIVLQGKPEAVNAAVQAIRVLDQPVMRGRASIRINPEHWSAEDLSAKLSEVLAAEGYSMPPANFSPRSGGARYPVILLPVPEINAILVFATGDTVADHVLDWAQELDVPVEPVVTESSFISYTPRNTTASHLAKVVDSLLSGRSATIGGSGNNGESNTRSSNATGNNSAASRGNSDSRGNVVVDSATNTLIFKADAEDRKTMLGILRNLDQPTRSALIEVTIAEVQLDDENEFGVQWLLRDAAVGDAVAGAITESITIGSGGLDINWLNSDSDARAVVNALASTNRATILSTPSIMARNGESAEIQVGQEVPIITSQQSSINNNVNTGGVLQSIQYRDTGVILKVTPTIHSGDLIDIEVEQEVSSAQSTVTGVEVSPTISTRRMSTKLNLRHGTTVLLGGLISSDVTYGRAGVPILKDIPLLGSLFSSTTESESRTELVILITPYILSQTTEFEAILRSFNKRLSIWNDHIQPAQPSIDLTGNE